MDDRERANEAPAVSRIPRWLGGISATSILRAQQLGIWALRLTRWRGHLLRTAHTVHLSAAEYFNTVAHLAYFVVPLPTRVEHATRAGQEGELSTTRATRPRARVIANPASGTLRNPSVMRELTETIEWLGEHGLPAELTLTERIGHATQLAREAVDAGMEMVIAAGGDGTVNDVIQALAGHTSVLGVLPLGTVNVWAREVGIPLNLAEAREVLVHGVRRRVDLGRAGPRYFLLMAGIGFDAEVTRRVEQGRLKRLGLKLLEYLATAGMLSLTVRPARITMWRSRKRRGANALMVIIGNTRLYGGALTFATRAVADDGLLDVVVVGGGGLLHRTSVVVRALLHLPPLGPHIRYERCRTIRLESTPPLPVQVDGEPVGMLPMTFSVAPLALTAVVPQTRADGLFERDPLPRRP